MRKVSLLIFPLILVLLGALVLSKCDGSGSASRAPTDSTTSPKGPAPDNNSANNPSLADTNYVKDRTRPITDTMKHDTGNARQSPTRH